MVHTASLFMFPNDEEEVVKPAVDCTLAVMKACTDSGVKRCVVTSSCESVICLADQDKPNFQTGFYDESFWSNPDRP